MYYRGLRFCLKVGPSCFCSKTWLFCEQQDKIYLPISGLDSDGFFVPCLCRFDMLTFYAFLFSCILNPLSSYFQYNLGKGCVFTYDAVGSYERVGYSSQGSGAMLITPFLDNQLKSPSPLLLPAKVIPS